MIMNFNDSGDSLDMRFYYLLLEPLFAPHEVPDLDEPWPEVKQSPIF
jgi:hypothetical protein